VIAARTRSEVEETATQIKLLGQHALPLEVDISNHEDVTRMVAAAVQNFGKINVLVNNAGMQGPLGFVIDNDVSQWIQTIHVNLIGTFLCTRAVLPIMIKQSSGNIINLSGGGAVSPRPYFTAYAASKAAVVRFTESVAEEVKTFNIQVNAIAPGAINTSMVKQVLAAGEVVGDKELMAAKRQIESGGASPEKAADLAVFLASDRSKGLSGRLISAAWDDWQTMTEERIKQIMSTDLYTLRRVVKEEAM
jgi:NAD(P)-dependent dehydrogenase (short-subunit alcohol dehydrogenase family)